MTRRWVIGALAGLAFVACTQQVDLTISGYVTDDTGYFGQPGFRVVCGDAESANETSGTGYFTISGKLVTDGELLVYATNEQTGFAGEETVSVSIPKDDQGSLLDPEPIQDVRILVSQRVP